MATRPSQPIFRARSPLLEAARSLAHRRGDAYAEAISAGNLMAAHLYAGNWDEAVSLSGEVLADDSTGIARAWVSLPLCAVQALRGDVDRPAPRWPTSPAGRTPTSLQARWGHAVARMIVSAAAGEQDPVLALGSEFIPRAIETEAASIEAVRNGWPFAMRAAIELGRTTDARRLLSLLDEQPAGYVPPYLRAQLANGHGLLAAAEGRHDRWRAPLNEAIDRLGELGYPYWLAVAQTDLAEWLVDQGRGAEASTRLDEAVTALRALRAVPALARAEAVGARLSIAPATG